MFSHTADDLDWLQQKWQTLSGQMSSDTTASQAIWQELVNYYSAPHRAYHNLSHTIALLRHAQQYHAQIHDMPMVEYAVWFHDVIYDTHAKDNEQKSAQWARNAMQRLGLSEPLIASVEHCILATHRHEIVQGIPDLPLFLDMDLAILGAPDAIYRLYSQAIRDEYSWVPEPLYRLGRSQVLKRFAQRPALFFTPAIATRLEALARRNLERELQELSFFK